MTRSETMRRWGWRAFGLMWIPFTTLMISILRMPEGSYSWTELPALARYSLLGVGFFFVAFLADVFFVAFLVVFFLVAFFEADFFEAFLAVFFLAVFAPFFALFFFAMRHLCFRYQIPVCLYL